jgi:hypothetical protein
MENKIEQEILEILKKNKEELEHANNTLKYLLIIKPDADIIFRISALGHDVERAINGKDEKKYDSHRDFKMAHSKRSAEIIKNLLEKNNFNKKDIERAYNLILAHEFGGNEEQNLLRDADSLSNFEWCDYMFGKLDINSLKGVAEKMFRRLSEQRRQFIGNIRFKNKEIRDIINLLKKSTNP